MEMNLGIATVQINAMRLIFSEKTFADKDEDLTVTCAIFSKSRRFEDIKYDTERGCCNKVRKSAESAKLAKSAKSA